MVLSNPSYQIDSLGKKVITVLLCLCFILVLVSVWETKCEIAHKTYSVNEQVYYKGYLNERSTSPNN